MRSDSLGLMVVNRAYEDVDALQGPKESFDDGQVFIAAHGGGGGQPLGGLTGPDHVKPIELRLALDRRQAACIAQQAIVNVHLKVLAYVIMLEHEAHFLPN